MKRKSIKDNSDFSKKSLEYKKKIIRDKIKQVKKYNAAYDRGLLTDEERYARVIKEWENAKSDLETDIKKEMAEKAKQANRYKKYVQGKEKGYIEDNSSDYMSNQAIKPDPSNIMDFNRFVVGEEIARGGKRGSEAYKHHLNVSKAIKAGKELAKGRGY